jgi:hypothetical protein
MHNDNSTYNIAKKEHVASITTTSNTSTSYEI